MRSLFEEQITHEQQGMVYHMEVHEDSFAEGLSYFPNPDEQAVVATSLGSIIIDLMGDVAPNHVGCFMRLAGERTCDGAYRGESRPSGVSQG